EKPTLQNIRLALGDFLARKTTRDDQVLIYYAGLGAPEADTTSKEKDGLAKYLIPRNVQPESLRSTAFAMEEVQGILARIPAERVVLLLDTSYSGVAGGRSFAPSNARPRTLSDQFLDRLTKSRGRLVAAMVLVNIPGTWRAVYPPLRHAPWHGWTPTDVIFPFFVFIVGVAIPLALEPRIGNAGRGAVVFRVVRRSLVIFALGIILNGFPEYAWATLRIPGVLQRIAVCYLAAAL